MEKIVVDFEIKTDKGIKAVEKLNAKINNSNKELNKTQSSFSKFGTNLKDVFSGLGSTITGIVPMLGKLRTALVSTGVGAIVVAFGGLVSLFASASKKGSEFAKGLSTLRAVTGKTSKELENITKQAKELGATTAFTAKQVLDLQTELAKLGFTISDIENSTPAILGLAASLEVDLASAAAFAGATVKGFGLDTKETQRVVDVMALSTSRSALDFEKLRESIKMVAPVASSAGVSIEKTTALLGALADRGISGSMAGTGLSKTFIELSKKGITLEDAFNRVNNSSNGLNTAIDLVGINGGKTLLNLASVGTEALEDLESQFLNAEGAAKQMSEVRLDNLSGDMTKLSSAWEGFLLGIEDGEGTINKLQRSVVQGLTKAISGLGTVIDFVTFAFVDKWDSAKMQFNGTVDIFKGLFTKFGANIKLFANNALIAISKIPFIGDSIDKDAVQTRIEEANQQLLRGQQQLNDGVDKLRKADLKAATFFGRFSVQQQNKAQRIQQEQEDKKNKEIQIAKEKESEEEREKRLEATKKEREKLQAIQDKYNKKAEDLSDKTEVEKTERQRERALAEIEALKLTQTEKREAIKAVNDYYDSLEKEAQIKDDEQNTAKEKELADLKKQIRDAEAVTEDERRALEIQKTIEHYDKLIELAKAQGLATEGLERAKANAINKINEGNSKNETYWAKLTQQEKARVVSQGLSNLSTILGEESAAGKAAAIASATISTYQSATDSYKSLAGIPIIGPALGFAAAGAAVTAGFANVKKIVSTKTYGGKGGGSAPSISASQPSAPSIPPSFNVVGASSTNQLAEAIGGQSKEPVKAYVVSNDVTTAQSLDRNIVNSASI